ncbi:hypothetical protein MtrunA17_Chr1g0146861 [Medicago truncatula]|uniref:Transmembrane protein n=1 Tax=Medicago truncatula TaxID=3880 RepID=I3RZS5_MEDTR|nr:unknown [Medicago truncatula]RHN76711.1 hypothetical protein MtrunA17_Chr1g0146861 [Medicago truncatula]
MASAARARCAVNHCFTQDFMMPPTSSKQLEPDFTTSDSTDSDMKWWLHVKTNLAGDTDYTCQHLNTLESKLDAFSTRLHGDNVSIGSDQTVKNFDAVSFVGNAATAAIEQQWNVYPKYMKNSDTRTSKIEASLNSDLYLTPKKKNEGEFWFSDDATSFLISEHCKSTSSDFEPHWLGAEKSQPWWRTTGKDDLASLVAKKSFEYVENCDLPEPNIKPFRKIHTLQPRETDKEENQVSSLNQKLEMCSSDSNGCTSTTLTSGCSFQDSDRTFSSSESKDSDSSCNKNSKVNSESAAKAELLKALCRSQTRAREAEKASQLFAYKQWLHVLQLENLCLQYKSKNQPLLNNLFPYEGKKHRKNRRKVKNSRRGIGKCIFAFAVGLALAGAGLLLGWTIGCMFPSF